LSASTMSLHNILEHIAAQRPIGELAAAIGRARRRREHLRVAPLMGAARVPVMATLARARAGGLSSILYVVSNAEAALRAADDLRQWLAPEQVLLYPPGDAMPYEHMSPGNQVVVQRLAVLRRLTEAPEPDAPGALVVITPVKALLQPTLTPEE